MARAKKITFEESMHQLEEIVQTMETGDISLDELLSQYTQGVKLSQSCMKALNEVEKAMDTMLKETDGEIQELELKIEGD
ncbi:MAG: exodeoxyribonuclease VII small subunit [Selenomonadaceae bacterium]